MICRSMEINRGWAAPQPVIWIYCSVGASLAVFHNIYRPILQAYLTYKWVKQLKGTEGLNYNPSVPFYSEGQDSSHHSLSGFRRMLRNRQVERIVVIPIEIRQRNLKLKDGWFLCHLHSLV